MSKYSTRYFSCDCGWPAHALAIDLDEDGSLVVYVANHRYDHSLWNRIKDAWRILRGDDHALSEVIIPAEDVDELVDYLNGLRPSAYLVDSTTLRPTRLKLTQRGTGKPADVDTWSGANLATTIMMAMNDSEIDEINRNLRQSKEG